jgi:hypothetical protein
MSYGSTSLPAFLLGRHLIDPEKLDPYLSLSILYEENVSYKQLGVAGQKLYEKKKSIYFDPIRDAISTLPGICGTASNDLTNIVLEYLPFLDEY